jgi:arylsulfatase A-like enzyme
VTRPNIVYIHSHDTGRYIEPYGHPVPTPNLRRLAETGVMFRNAFSAAPTCGPSRAALLTGLYPHQCGMFGLPNYGQRLNDPTRHLSHVLREAGYETALFGFQHEADAVTDLGYDRVGRRDFWAAESVAPDAAEFLYRRATGGKDGPPFFLSVGSFETHTPFHPTGPWEDPRFCRPPAPIPDTPATRQMTAGFRTSARHFDWGVGWVLEALEGYGMAEDTLVIATTDHGPAFPGMKCTLTDHGIGVMLLMRGPGGLEGGKVVDAMVSHLDVAPTLMALIGLEAPADLVGSSMLPLLGGADRIREEVHAEITYHAAYDPQRCVRTDRYKYVRRFAEPHGPILPNVDESPAKDVWLAHGWRERQQPTEELYDVVFDPMEACNLADRPENGPVLADMRGRLDRWMTETNDPLLDGPIRVRGALVCDRDGLSPQEPRTRVE